ncbi:MULTISPECIES: hypothetical protein [Flavobacterium]|uniref:Uncharacterized protein n=1 Tax=Flavobacterium jumunjinense TaxID=998845 RepID=A0ABV5GJ65_9FLAO|nr:MULTISPECIES: hypothetical protein [Flavobacterium]
MSEKEANELIKNYVLENFDERWHTDPLFFEEYQDFFEFHINSKKYFESGDFLDSFVGLGSAFLSKKFGEIVQYGSLGASHYIMRDFLITEYRLNVIRTKYEIGRADYDYRLVIKNVTDFEKASKYINGIFVYKGTQYVKEIHYSKILEIPSTDYFSLLNLLYFNVIDPFCECSYQKLIHEFDLSKPLREFECISKFELSDRLFYKNIENKVVQAYSSFDINKNYKVIIFEVFDNDKFKQYFETVSFKRYGEDEQTGFWGYNSYLHVEIEEIMKKEKKIFDFVEGDQLLFFLFVNILESFCKIEIKIMSNDLNIC